MQMQIISEIYHQSSSRRSYKTFFFFVFQFLLFSLNVFLYEEKKNIDNKMIKLSRKKQKNSLLAKKKRFIASVPGKFLFRKIR